MHSRNLTLRGWGTSAAKALKLPTSRFTPERKRGCPKSVRSVRVRVVLLLTFASATPFASFLAVTRTRG